MQRDDDAPVDRVNLMIDYDGDGRTGYNFTLNLTDGIQDARITNERSFSKDWDANWTHAVSEDGDTWSAEMLIPWYVAPMRKGKDGKRTIGIYLDRVIGSTGERVAWPDASYERPRFMSDFAPDRDRGLQPVADRGHALRHGRYDILEHAATPTPASTSSGSRTARCS